MRARPHWVRDHDQDPYASVQMSGGPTRVSSSDPDPDFEPRSVGFVRNARALAATDPSPNWRAFAERSIDAARPPIADADPDEWGDQA